MGAPDRVTVGAIGAPGQRTFYLQAVEGARTVTLKLEKQQVVALGELLGELLSDLPAAGDPPADAGLDEPVLAEWAVGTMQLAYDRDADRVVLIAEELVEETGTDGSLGRLQLTRAQAAGLVARSRDLGQAGRPPCPFCGHPLDPAGHTCPRTNGHRPPER